MVMLANQPPHLVCIFRIPCGCSRLPFPAPHARYGKNLTPVSCFQFLVSSPETRNQKLDTALPLAILESLSRAFLSILLAFIGARLPTCGVPYRNIAHALPLIAFSTQQSAFS